MSMNPEISFIIPAYNEGGGIATTLKSIFSGGNSMPSFEVIVVDHNSNDNTGSIAEEFSAKVHRLEGGTIAGVRNFGASFACANILVFLDADISLTSDWFANIGVAIELLKYSPLVITGSHCIAPPGGNVMERYWFNSYAHEQDTTNLGSGHMIMTRELFDRLGGFDKSLKTGEDYDICMRAIGVGGGVVNSPGLLAVHRDYPQTFKQFIQREAWHGTGDVKPFVNVLRSKVALAAILFLLLHILGGLMLLLPAFSWPLGAGVLAGVPLLCVLCSINKFKGCGLSIILVNSLIFYLYLLGRALSFRECLPSAKI